MEDAKSLAQTFFALDPARRRIVHLALCEHALEKWKLYANFQGRIHYIESVVGTQQAVDLQLPLDACAAVQQGIDSQDIAKRYQEPVTAMQDDDLAFPENITYAYYAIYNLFSKYARNENIDDWLIVNQALAAEEDSQEWDRLLKAALQIGD